MNILMCSVGRRGELLNDFKKSMSKSSKIVATDSSRYAPAVYLADKYYIVPSITDPYYLDSLQDICRKEKVNAITTFIDPEIEMLSDHRSEFEQLGVEVLAPYEQTAKYCFDKYLMFQYLVEKGIPTIMTWGSIDDFEVALKNKKVSFPVFVKPRKGSGSVGARKITDFEKLKNAVWEDGSLIIQEYMDCTDLDVDVYVDTISHQAVSAFSKRKLETRIGGASKTVSFKDEILFELIRKICSIFRFSGPVDMDFFYKDRQYYLSEINPRFGGAYLHAFGAGVDFIKLIENNLSGIENQPRFGNYDENVVMMMYDSAVIKKF